jgi:DNA-binding NarL/FixJ family response regulator
MERIKIMVAEDHNYSRQAFCAYLAEEQSDVISITGQAADGKELIELVKKNEPDIVLLDLEMPIMNGQETLKYLCEHHHKVKVIILSMHDSEDFITELFSLGARAYLSKGCNMNDIILTITKVHSEGYYFTEKTSRVMRSGLALNRKTEPLVEEEKLTKREVEVLQHLCEEKEAQQIAEALHISENTVDFHRKNIYRKTKSKSIVSLFKYAIRAGITKITS